MINKIQEHHNDEEIEVIRLQNDIDQWKSELGFLIQEINFYLELLNSKIINDIDANKKEANDLLNQFLMLKVTSENIENKCELFKPKLEEKNECEDIQCDHAYLNEHLILRYKIDIHMNDVRKVKGSAFKYIRCGIKNFLN